MVTHHPGGQRRHRRLAHGRATGHHWGAGLAASLIALAALVLLLLLVAVPLGVASLM